MITKPLLIQILSNQFNYSIILFPVHHLIQHYFALKHDPK